MIRKTRLKSIPTTDAKAVIKLLATDKDGILTMSISFRKTIDDMYTGKNEANKKFSCPVLSEKFTVQFEGDSLVVNDIIKKRKFVMEPDAENKNQILYLVTKGTKHESWRKGSTADERNYIKELSQSYLDLGIKKDRIEKLKQDLVIFRANRLANMQVILDAKKESLMTELLQKKAPGATLKINLKGKSGK